MLASACTTISNSTMFFLLCRRNNLFKISGMRGVYPQFFLIHNEEKIEFLGDWEKIEAVNDASGLPDEVLERHPEILTWGKVMGYT
jgi:hypothetical protein